MADLLSRSCRNDHHQMAGMDEHEKKRVLQSVEKTQHEVTLTDYQKGGGSVTGTHSLAPVMNRSVAEVTAQLTQQPCQASAATTRPIWVHQGSSPQPL